MTVKLGNGPVIAAALVAGSSPAAQNPRHETAKGPALIDSIQGPDLYKTHCASCHGIGAKGNGPMAKSLTVRLSDSTRIAARNGGTFPLMRVERIIAGKELAPIGHGTSDMPVWRPIFSRAENDQDRGRVRIDNLARSLRDIQTK
ncbi:MAG: c-type cytochrome [Acidobacteriota bacterium]